MTDARPLTLEFVQRLASSLVGGGMVGGTAVAVWHWWLVPLGVAAGAWFAILALRWSR